MSGDRNSLPKNEQSTRSFAVQTGPYGTKLESSRPSDAAPPEVAVSLIDSHVLLCFTAGMDVQTDFRCKLGSFTEEAFDGIAMIARHSQFLPALQQDNMAALKPWLYFADAAHVDGPKLIHCVAPVPDRWMPLCMRVSMRRSALPSRSGSPPHPVSLDCQPLRRKEIRS